tara:strand:+ start:4076 stop:4342 length:267 start_codon:yes stop_codon:yes gene_type:complete
VYSKNWGGAREGSGAARKWDGEECENITFRVPRIILARLAECQEEVGLKNRNEALVYLLDPALYTRSNPKRIKTDPGPQKEKVVITEL